MLFTVCISHVPEADLDSTNSFVAPGLRLPLTVLPSNSASAKWLAPSLYFEAGEARLSLSQAEVWLRAMKLALPKLAALAVPNPLRHKSLFRAPRPRRHTLRGCLLKCPVVERQAGHEPCFFVLTGFQRCA